MTIQEFAVHLSARREGTGWRARCPAHDDREPSLSINESEEGNILVYCHAGCSTSEIVEAAGLTMEHLFQDGPGNPPTLAHLAELKCLPVEFLRSCGVHEREDGIGICYVDSTGRALVKRRTSLVARIGSRWVQGEPLIAYGIWKRSEIAAARWLVLVEGESDTWTAWFHRVPALGIPGARATACLTADLLEGVETIYVVQDDDEAGAEFVRNCAARLRQLGWQGQARGVRLRTHDLSDLHVDHARRGSSQFLDEFMEACGRAWPMPAGAIEASESAWRDPEPIEPVRAPDIPIDVLPPSLRPWAADEVERLDCPSQFVVVAALVSAAALIGRKLSIRPKALDDSWIVAPNLWGLAVGEPAAKKSPALSSGMAHLQDIEKADARAFDSFDAVVLELQRKELRKRMEEEVRAGRDPAHLRRDFDDLQVTGGRRRIVNDTTVEKLGEILRANPNGVLLYRDELKGFLEQLEKQGREGDRQFYLEAWEPGGSTYAVDRIARGSFRLHGAMISLLGGIQPGVVTQLIRSASWGGAADDGLLQRFQLFVRGYATVDRFLDRPPNATARDAARQVFVRLDAETRTQLAGSMAAPGNVLRFDPEAQAVFNAWWQAHQRRSATEELPGLRAHLQKYASLVPKLALLVHVIDVLAGDSSPGMVTADATNDAIALVDLLAVHVRVIYGEALAPTAPAIELARRIMAGALPQRFVASEIKRKHWSNLPEQSVERALAVLAEKHWIRRRELVTGGRPRIEYVINPGLPRSG